MTPKDFHSKWSKIFAAKRKKNYKYNSIALNASEQQELLDDIISKEEFTERIELIQQRKWHH